MSRARKTELVCSHHALIALSFSLLSPLASWANASPLLPRGQQTPTPWIHLAISSYFSLSFTKGAQKESLQRIHRQHRYHQMYKLQVSSIILDQVSKPQPTGQIQLTACVPVASKLRKGMCVNKSSFTGAQPCPLLYKLHMAAFTLQ